jgi:hypothetical protein
MQPEIFNDELYYHIVQLVEQKQPKTILEIGSGEGLGSTAAFIEGAKLLEKPPEIYCMEINQDRFEKLQENTKQYPFVHCYRLSSIPVKDFPAEGVVESTLQRHPSLKTNQYHIEIIMSWRNGIIDEIQSTGVDCEGILQIATANGLDKFDMVLIDGGPFTGYQEMSIVCGHLLKPCSVVVLDDIIDIKNWDSFNYLMEYPLYKKIGYNPDLRNGYASFEYTGGD